MPPCCFKLNFLETLERNESERGPQPELEANFQLTCHWSLGFSAQEPKVNNCIWRKNLFTKRWKPFVLKR